VSGRGEADKGDAGNNGAGSLEELESGGPTGVVEITGSSLGPGFTSYRGLDNGGVGLVVDWRLDMRLGLGASGGGVPSFPVIDPLRDGATGAGESKAWGDVRSSEKYQYEVGIRTQHVRLVSWRWSSSRGSKAA